MREACDALYPIAGGASDRQAWGDDVVTRRARRKSIKPRLIEMGKESARMKRSKEMLA